MSNGNININIDKLPESPWFWVLVAIGVFLVLLATNHVATAVVFFFAAVAVISLAVNLFTDYTYPFLWWVCGICAALALILGLLFVPSEWQKEAAETALKQILATQIPV